MKFRKQLYRLFSFLLMSILSLSLLAGCAQEDLELAADVLTAILETEVEEETISEETTLVSEETPPISEEGTYTSKEEVAEYIHLYGHLPSNFITKKEAKNLGWVSNEGNLDEVAPGMSIGGDYF